MNAVEVVQHANKAYNAHDADALAAAYAEGTTYSDSRDGQVFTGERIANYAKAVCGGLSRCFGRVDYCR